MNSTAPQKPQADSTILHAALSDFDINYHVVCSWYRHPSHDVCIWWDEVKHNVGPEWDKFRLKVIEFKHLS